MKENLSMILVAMMVISTMGVLSLHGPASPAIAEEITVGPDGDYQTIQQAIDNATEGATIYVWAGTYHENVLVNKTLTLVGNGTEDTIIDAQGSGSAVVITADWVNIAGFTVRGGGDTYPNAGIRLDSVNNCRIENNNISSNAHAGIFLGSSDNNIINNCTITENGGPISGGNGVYLSGSYYNTIQNSKISFNYRDGFYVVNAHYNNILNNTINNNSLSGDLYHGIQFASSRFNTILNNTIYGNSVSGIYLYSYQSAYSSSFNTIQNNTLSSNEYGIRIGTAHPGDQRSWSNENVISNNTIADNDYGIHLSYCEQNQLYHNRFLNNANQAYDDGDNIWNLTYPQGGNYWSHLGTEDTKKGVSQNITGSDGIVDTPFNIPGGGVDRYPLVSPDFVPPTIDYIEIRSAPYGFGTILEDVETDIFQTTVGYAAGYNNSMGYLVEVNAEWSVTNANGATAYTSPTTGGTSTFHAGNTAGNATWAAEYDAATGSANFTIVIPPIHNIDKDTYHNEIQVAIDHADPGNTIVVSPGNYDANILVNKSLTLLGPGPEHPTFNMSFGPHFFMNISADHVTVSGFNFSISGSSFSLPGHGVTLYNVENCVIEDNRFHRLIGRAIEIVEGGNHTIHKNTVFQGGLSESMGLYAISSRNNTITNNIFLSSSNGVRLYNFNNNVIHNNTINSSNRDGMLLENSDNNTLMENTVSNNNWHGIRMRYSSNNTLMENIISNNTDGIQLEYAGSNNNTFSQNIIKDNSGRGIRLWSDNNDNTIIDNIIFNNGEGSSGAGIHIGGAHRTTISNNTLADNWEKGIWVLDSFGTVVSGNNISSSMHGIGFQGSPTLIFNNTLSNNDIGINNPQHSTIYHNRFIGNTLHASTFSDTNTWNRTYALGGGNYWDNWTSPDALKGEEQDIPGADGIVDIPMMVAGLGGIPDYYPWANPYFLAPTMDYLKIHDSPGGEGITIEDQILFPEDNVVGYATAYNHTSGYLGDVHADWSVVGDSSTSPEAGISSTFTASSSYETATWTAEHGVLSTSVIFSVTHPLDYIRVRTQPGGEGENIEGYEVDVGYSITGYAAAYNTTHGYLGEVSVQWSTEGADASTTPTAGVSSQFNAGLIGGTATWISFYSNMILEINFTIRNPVVDYIHIVGQEGTGEEEIIFATVDVGHSVTGYAAGFNLTSGYVGDVAAEWSAINDGANASTSPATGTSSTFYSGNTGGNSTWTADCSGITSSVNFTVNPPVVNWIYIRSEPGGEGSIITYSTVPIEIEIEGYAAAYNQTIGYIGDVAAEWSVDNSSGATAFTSLAVGISSTFISGNTIGTAVWTAEYGGKDHSITMNIVEHGIDYIIIGTASGGVGEAISDTNMDISKSITGYAAAYNTTHGYIEDINAEWAVYGGTEATTSPSTGTDSTFQSGNITGTATWTASYMSMQYSVIFEITEPHIAQTNPTHGATGVSPLAGNYSIRFSESMDTDVWIWGGDLVTDLPITQWEWSTDSTWLNGTYSTLSPETTYSVTLSTNFVNTGGTPLGGNRDLSFTTAQVNPPFVHAGPNRITNNQFSQEGYATDDYGIESYLWSVTSGPGEIQFGSSNQNTTTIFAYSDGEYIIRLTATNVFGMSEWDEFELIWDNEPPQVYAGEDQTVNQGETVYFDGTGSTDNIEIANYTWDFHDGTSSVALYGPEPSHVFPVIGSYQVQLSVRDIAGNINHDYMWVFVSDDVPPQITSVSVHPSTQPSGEPVNITATVVDNTGVNMVYVHIVDQGNFSMQNILGTDTWYYNITFHSAGEYSYSISAVDSNNNWKTSQTYTFTIVESEVTSLAANAGADMTVAVGSLVVFDGSRSTGDIEVYRWTIYDDGAVEFFGVNPSYTFNNEGQYTVTLTVEDSRGYTNSDTLLVTVTLTGEDPDDPDDPGDPGDDPEDGRSPLGTAGGALPILLIIAVAVIIALLYMKSKSKGGGGMDEDNEPKSFTDMEEVPAYRAGSESVVESAEEATERPSDEPAESVVESAEETAERPSDEPAESVVEDV